MKWNLIIGDDIDIILNQSWFLKEGNWCILNYFALFLTFLILSKWCLIQCEIIFCQFWLQCQIFESIQWISFGIFIYLRLLVIFFWSVEILRSRLCIFHHFLLKIMLIDNKIHNFRLLFHLIMDELFHYFEEFISFIIDVWLIVSIHQGHKAIFALKLRIDITYILIGLRLILREWKFSK